MSSWQTRRFEERLHPRAGGGKFAAKPDAPIAAKAKKIRLRDRMNGVNVQVKTSNGTPGKGARTSPGNPAPAGTAPAVKLPGDVLGSLMDPKHPLTDHELQQLVDDGHAGDDDAKALAKFRQMAEAAKTGESGKGFAKFAASVRDAEDPRAEVERRWPKISQNPNIAAAAMQALYAEEHRRKDEAAPAAAEKLPTAHPEAIPADPLGSLLDHSHPLTPTALLDHLAHGRGTPEQRQKMLDALDEFRKMGRGYGDGDVAGISAYKFRQAVFNLEGHQDPHGYAAGILGVIGGDEYAKHRAFVMSELYKELHARSDRSVGMEGGPRFTSTKEAGAWADENMPGADLPDEQRRAAHDYTTFNSGKINAKLRGVTLDERGIPEDQVDAEIKLLDEAISQSPTPAPLVLMRSDGDISLQSLGADVNDDVSLQSLVGTVSADPAFLSTSIGLQSSAAGKAGTGNVTWLLRTPAGTPALYVDRDGMTGWRGEREVLLARDTNRIIHAVYRSPDPQDPRIYVEAEIVPAGYQPPDDWVPQARGDAWKEYLR